MGLRFLFVITDLIFPLIVGYWLKKTSRVSAAQCNWLIRFNIIIIYTILSLLSFWVLPLRAELFLLPLFGLSSALLPGLIAYAGRFYKRFDSICDQGSYLITSIPSNIGTLGGLCTFILYGELGFAYAQMVCVFQNILLFMICFPLGQYYKGRVQGTAQEGFLHMDWRSVILSWNQMPMVGMVVGMVLYIGDVPRPPFLGSVFESLVHIGAWTALLPIGYMIDFSGLSHYYKKTLNLAPIKMIFSPLLLFLMARLCFDDPVILGTLLVLMSTPCAINALVTIRLYGLNVDLSMAPFISTTLIYLLLLYPLFYFLVTNGIVRF